MPMLHHPIRDKNAKTPKQVINKLISELKQEKKKKLR